MFLILSRLADSLRLDLGLLVSSRLETPGGGEEGARGAVGGGAGAEAVGGECRL